MLEGGLTRDGFLKISAVLSALALLFTGDLNGNLLALDARSGRVLYNYDTKNAIAGGIIFLSCRRQTICRRCGGQHVLRRVESDR